MSWRPFRVPFGSAFQTSRATLRVREGFMVCVEAEGGERGWGEASPLSEFEGGTLQAVSGALAATAAGLPGQLGEAAWDMAGLETGAEETSARVACAGIETAIADLCARSEGVPLWQWLARRAGVRVEDDPVIPVNTVVDAEAPGEVARAVDVAMGDGFRAVKLKVGHGAEADLQRITAARESGGAELEVRIDANGGWSEEEALVVLSRCRELGVAFCEQPLDPGGENVLETTAKVRARTGVRIALDESCRSAAAVERIAEAGAGDTIVVKPMLTGLREAIEMLRKADELHLRALVTTTFDTGVGTAMAVHLAALLPEPRMACGLATLDHLQNSLVTAGHYPQRGFVRPGAGAGLGVAVDAAALESCATGRAREVVGT